MSKDQNRPIVKGDKAEAINCYAYITGMGSLSKIACQRAIWNLFEVEVDGYSHILDTKRGKV